MSWDAVSNLRRTFDSIVASGENGAKPHAHPTDKIVERGTLVTVDWGVRVDGYCSDCTRTFSTGRLPDRLREAYDEVCENSDVEPAFGPDTPEPDFEPARRRVAAFLDQAAGALPAEAAPDGWTGFESAVRRARRLSDLLDTNRAAEFVP